MPHAPRPTPATPPTVDARDLVAALPTAQAEVVRQLLSERDSLLLLHEAMIELEETEDLEKRLRVLVDALQRMGFRRVTLSLRDESLDQTMLVAAGLSLTEERELRVNPESGAVWRRRLEQLDRFRISSSYYLDARDAWVQREFGAGVQSKAQLGDEPQ